MSNLVSNVFLYLVLAFSPKGKIVLQLALFLLQDAPLGPYK